MCCGLRTHVKVISLVCFIVTGLGAFVLLINNVIVSAYENDIQESVLRYGGSVDVTLVIHVLIFVVWLLSEIFCLIGCIKNNKFLLIPFASCLFLQILACVGFAILFGIMGRHAIDVPSNYQFHNQYDKEDIEYISNNFGGNFLYFSNKEFITIMMSNSIALGLSVYFFVTTVMFYKELSCAVNPRREEEMALRPYTSSAPVSAGGAISSSHIPNGSENLPINDQQAFDAICEDMLLD